MCAVMFVGESQARLLQALDSVGRYWGVMETGEDRLNITELGLARMDIWIVVYNIYNTFPYIYLRAFLMGGDSTDLLENSFLVRTTKMQPYILRG